MHKGMGGPHLFHVSVRSSDPENQTTVLKVKANIVSLERWRRSRPDAFYLPRALSRIKLRSETEGVIAEDHARKVFGTSGALESAYLGQYRDAKKETRLLVAEYKDAEKAEEIFATFVARMRLARSTPSAFRKFDMAGQEIYLLVRGGRKHFYFLKGLQVVWLSPDASVINDSLIDVLKFFRVF
jgi:hypothetical protein